MHNLAKKKKMHKCPQDRPYTILWDNRKKNSRTGLGGSRHCRGAQYHGLMALGPELWRMMK